MRKLLVEKRYKSLSWLLTWIKKSGSLNPPSRMFRTYLAPLRRLQQIKSWKIKFQSSHHNRKWVGHQALWARIPEKEKKTISWACRWQKAKRVDECLWRRKVLARRHKKRTYMGLQPQKDSRSGWMKLSTIRFALKRRLLARLMPSLKWLQLSQKSCGSSTVRLRLCTLQINSLVCFRKTIESMRKAAHLLARVPHLTQRAGKRARNRPHLSLLKLSRCKCPKSHHKLNPNIKVPSLSECQKRPFKSKKNSVVLSALMQLLWLKKKSKAFTHRKLPWSITLWKLIWTSWRTMRSCQSFSR